MKKLTALLLALALLSGCAGTAYSGKTETVWVLAEDRTILYDHDTGEHTTSSETYSYDSLGNMVRSRSYYQGKPSEEYRCTYNESGDITREVQWKYYWRFRLPVSRTEHTYDADGWLLKTTYRNGFGIKTGEDVYTRDEETNTTTWDGTYDTQTTYYNENGDIIRKVTYSEPADLEMETVYLYDEQARHIKTEEYRDGVLCTLEEITLDEEGRILEVIWYDENGKTVDHTVCEYTENTTITWDIRGYQTVETLRPDGQPETTELYDNMGTLIARTDYTYREIRIPAEEE